MKVLAQLDSLESPSQVVFIDDRKSNVDAAIEVGIDGIHFLDADQLAMELRQRGIRVGS